jgi:hypothetical protein
MQCYQPDFSTEPFCAAVSDKTWKLFETVCESHDNWPHAELPQVSEQIDCVGPAMHVVCEAASKPENVPCETMHVKHSEGSQFAVVYNRHDASIYRE